MFHFGVTMAASSSFFLVQVSQPRGLTLALPTKGYLKDRPLLPWMRGQMVISVPCSFIVSWSNSIITFSPGLTTDDLRAAILDIELLRLALWLMIHVSDEATV